MTQKVTATKLGQFGVSSSLSDNSVSVHRYSRKDVLTPEFPPSPSTSRRCFNPCCDGTDSSTSRTYPRTCSRRRGFNPCCDGTDSSTWVCTRMGYKPGQVSILVVMERTHRRIGSTVMAISARCFNPCCDGTDSSTSVLLPMTCGCQTCFNPCCDGTDSSTFPVSTAKQRYATFQSLL